jgi:hypothetical protein
LLTLTKNEKEQLLSRGIVLCRDLVKEVKILAEINVSETRIRKIMEEVNSICESRAD